MARVNLGTDSSGRPLVVDDRTLAKLRYAEEQLGFTFTIVQGSWRGSSGAAASAGTHDRGGVIDLRTWNLPSSISTDRAVLELRKAGLIAWYRFPPKFDQHIHAIDYGNPDLAPSAAQQVRMWEQGYDGLASWGKDNGPRVTIPKNPPKEDYMSTSEGKAHLERIESKVDKLTEMLGNFRKNEFQRDMNEIKRDLKRFQELKKGQK